MTNTKGTLFAEGVPTFNHSAPSDVTGFQKQLTELAGTDLKGQPRLRIIWGQSPESKVLWEGKWRQRYLYKTTRDAIGWKVYGKKGTRFVPGVREPKVSKDQLIEQVWQENDIGVPRWFIEQLIAPEVACQEWDKDRFDYDPETHQLVDSMGPAPIEGWYEEAFYCIASHERCCPEGSFIPGCRGAYREPQSHDFAYVQWLWFQLNKEPFKYDWNEIPPPEAVVQALLDRKTRLANEQAKKIEELEYGVRSTLAKGQLFGGGHWDMGAAFQRARKF